MGEGHPERPERLVAIENELRASRLDRLVVRAEAPEATREQLLPVHDAAAIADFDVHHGNGTEDIFRDESRVLMVSTFQHPFYPGSGVEGRSERMVNVPLPAGASGEEFRAAVIREWLPALERFQPEMIFVSAGFDAHRDDGMAMLRLVEADYA